MLTGYIYIYGYCLTRVDTNVVFVSEDYIHILFSFLLSEQWFNIMVFYKMLDYCKKKRLKKN